MENFLNSGSFRNVYDCGNGWVVKYPTSNYDAEEYPYFTRSDFSSTEHYENSLDDWNEGTCEKSIQSNIDELNLFKKYGRKFSCLCKIDVKHSCPEFIYMKKIEPFLDKFEINWNWEGNNSSLSVTRHSDRKKFELGKYKYNWKREEIITILYRMAAAKLVNGYQVRVFENQIKQMEKCGINITRDLEARNIGFDGDEIKILDYGWY